MRVNVRLFGPLREAVGAKELHVQLPDGADARVLRALLTEQYPAFGAPDARLRVSRNREFAAEDAPLADGDEVAFLPPVSGGSGSAAAAEPAGDARCTISALPLDAERVSARVVGPDAGGLVTFVGAVRDVSRGEPIEHLEYEAYPEMAIQEMDRICDEAGRRWPGTRVAIAHRFGHVGIGVLAVVVAAASAHRAEAFEACRFAIDALKQTVPIWKKEVARSGAYWVDDHA
jgi:molybdopterin synthase catalytic subunit